jgi:SAM-dependent methyltransferase
MKKSLLDILVCPQCRAPLRLETPQTDRDSDEIQQGTLVCGKCGQKYMIRDGIPVLLMSTDYLAPISGSFGFQWRMRKKKLFETKTLYGRDPETALADFFERLRITPAEVRGKRILDAGCGSGILDHELSKTGCEVVGVDLSDPAGAYALNRDSGNVHIVRADIFNLPFADGTFDIVWSEGVLMITPDPKKAFLSLQRVLKKGGLGYVWIYSKSPQERIRRLLRTPRMPRSLLFILCYLLVIPYAAWQALRILIRYRATAFAFFDALSPKYQSGHGREEVRDWFLSTGFSAVEMTEDRGPFWQAVWGVGIKKQN